MFSDELEKISWEETTKPSIPKLTLMCAAHCRRNTAM